MKKILMLTCLAALALTFAGCGKNGVLSKLEKVELNPFKHRRDSQTKTCISNMRQLQVAAESWVLDHGFDKTPTVRDLCGPDKFLKEEPACPKDDSHYKITHKKDEFEFEVKCGSGDPDHVLPR